MEECKKSGGALPELREITETIQAGVMNGSNKWVWLADAGYFYSQNYGHFQTRWNGTGDTTWTFTSNANIETPEKKRNFRCVYSPRFR